MLRYGNRNREKRSTKRIQAQLPQHSRVSEREGRQGERNRGWDLAMTSLKEKVKAKMRRNWSSRSMAIGRLSLSWASWTNLSPWKIERERERGRTKEVGERILMEKKKERVIRSVWLKVEITKLKIRKLKEGQKGGEQDSWCFIRGICCGEHGTKQHCYLFLYFLFFFFFVFRYDFTDM